MTWHFGFVGYSIASFGLSASGLNASAATMDVIALTFLMLMTLTSFSWAARHMTAATWRRLHKTGIYVIWFVATYIYLGNVRHGGDLVHDVTLSALVAAYLLRVAAWRKLRARYVPVPASTTGTGHKSR